MSTTRLPVLFLTDLVVLPGMVVPIELDDAARAAVDTAKRTATTRCWSRLALRTATPRTVSQRRSCNLAGWRRASLLR